MERKQKTSGAWGCHIDPNTGAIAVRPATYDRLTQALRDLLYDMQILAGERVNPHSDVSWQDVAGTASVNAQVLASYLSAARDGKHEGFMVFPSPAEVLESLDT